MVLWTLAVGLAAATRPSLQLAIDIKYHSLKDVFMQAVETFAGDISASVCAFNRENREFGVRCDLETEHWDRSSKGNILSECVLVNFTVANGTQPLQSLCKSLQVPGLSLNSVFLRPEISYSELETLLCCSSALSSPACLPYSPVVCSSRHLQAACYTKCTQSHAGHCTVVCPVCPSDDKFCLCRNDCYRVSLNNDICGKSCNASTSVEVIPNNSTNTEEGANTTVVAITCSCIGVCLYGLYRLFAIVGGCVYALTKTRWKIVTQRRYFASEPVASVPAISDVEERVIAQLSSQRIGSITSEDIDNCCPQILYMPSLNEFGELICTVCLGE